MIRLDQFDQRRSSRQEQKLQQNNNRGRPEAIRGRMKTILEIRQEQALYSSKISAIKMLAFEVLARASLNYLQGCYARIESQFEHIWLLVLRDNGDMQLTYVFAIKVIHCELH